MTIFYHIGDLEFNATNPQDLKAELEEYFSYKGLRPSIEVLPDQVRIDIDDEKIRTAEAKVKLAFEFCSMGNFITAKEYLRDALDICPLYSEAHRALAQIHMQEGRPEDAVAACSEALKCDPKNMWAMILMGNLMLNHRGDKKEALKYYNRVLDCYPENTLALNNVAGVKLAMERYDEALPLFERVLEKDITYANAHYGKAACLLHLGRKEDAFEAARIGSLKGKSAPENPDTMRQVRKQLVSIGRQIAQEHDYEADALAIKDEIEKEFGVPVEFRPDPSLPVLGKLKYYRHHGLDRNLVLYNPGKPFTWHYVIHELMHLYMFSRNSREGVSKLVCSNEEYSRRFENRFGTFFRPLRNRIGPAQFAEFWKSLYDGLCTRAMNSPLDLFVEDRIFQEYPAVRPLQMLSMLDQEMSNMKADETATSSKSFPKAIVDASLVMNLVQSLQVNDLYGMDMTPGHKASRSSMKLAESLYEEYKAYRETYKDGDEYELMEYFLGELHLQDLFYLSDETDSGAPVKDTLPEPTAEEQRLEDAFQAANADGADPAKTMVMALHMVGALEYLEKLSKTDVKRIAYDIAMLGVGGISPEKDGYTVPSIPGRTFGGYEMLAWYYVSWSLAIPEMVDKLNLPFSSAYAQARSMMEAKKSGGSGN